MMFSPPFTDLSDIFIYPCFLFQSYKGVTMSRRRKDKNEFDDNIYDNDGKRKNLALFLALILIMAGVGGASAYWLLSGSGGGSIDAEGNIIGIIRDLDLLKALL